MIFIRSSSGRNIIKGPEGCIQGSHFLFQGRGLTADLPRLEIIVLTFPGTLSQKIPDLFPRFPNYHKIKVCFFRNDPKTIFLKRSFLVSFSPIFFDMVKIWYNVRKSHF